MSVESSGVGTKVGKLVSLEVIRMFPRLTVLDYIVRITHPSPSPVRERPIDRDVERLSIATHSPRSSHDTLLIAPSPSRHRSHSRHYHRREPSERRSSRAASQHRSTPVLSRSRRRSSPVRMVHRREDRDESDKLHTGPLAIIARPRDSDEDLRRAGHVERRSGGELVRHPDLFDSEDEEELEVKKERKCE